jgi:hypothetical protein
MRPAETYSDATAARARAVLNLYLLVREIAGHMPVAQRGALRLSAYRCPGKCRPRRQVPARP